jgi:hypothetical protein
VQLTDRTVLTVRLCCQSTVLWFVVTGKCLKPLHRHVISRYAHHFNNVTQYCYGRTKCVVWVTFLCDLLSFYDWDVFNLKLKGFNLKWTLMSHLERAVAMCMGTHSKKDCVIVFRSFNSSKSIFQLKTLLFMKDRVPIDTLLVQIPYRVTNYTCYRMQQQVNVTLLPTVRLQWLSSGCVMRESLVSQNTHV